MAQEREGRVVRADGAQADGQPVLGVGVRAPQDQAAHDAAQVRPPAPWRGRLARRVEHGPHVQPAGQVHAAGRGARCGCPQRRRCGGTCAQAQARAQAREPVGGPGQQRVVEIQTHKKTQIHKTKYKRLHGE